MKASIIKFTGQIIDLEYPLEIRMQLFRKFIALLILVMSIAACQASESKESGYWNENVSRIKELKFRYKAFAPVLNQILKEGYKAYEEAEQIKELEKKTEALKKANNILNLSNPVIYSFVEIGKNTSDIRSSLAELRKMKVGEKDRPQVTMVTKKAREALKFSRVNLAKKDNRDPETAEENLENVLEKLKFAQRELYNRKQTIKSRLNSEVE